MNTFGLPDLGVGIGLRTVHFGEILAGRPALDWFEVLSENFMDSGGRPSYVLDHVVERYPVALHGVSMSIGSTDPLDREYLRKLKALAKRTRAAWVSDHLCWTGVVGRNTHDLLPLPYDAATLRHVTRRVKQVQDVLPTIRRQFEGFDIPGFDEPQAGRGFGLAENQSARLKAVLYGLFGQLGQLIGLQFSEVRQASQQAGKALPGRRRGIEGSRHGA